MKRAHTWFPSSFATRSTLWWVVALAPLLLLAFWLRWRYVREISLYVDEFTTLWAARQVQEHGAPFMPSGVLYTRGLLASYVEALFLTLFGFSYTIGRLPSVLFGLATIVAVFLIGRREWRSSVGWLAAIGLTLLPEAIIWSARARFYAQLQFFALLAVWAAFDFVVGNGIRDTGNGKRNSQFTIHNSQFAIRPWLFPLFFILALFSQEETILLYPAIVGATLLWRGWRFFLRREVALVHLICVAAMGVRYAIEIIGQPGYFETIQAERPYVGLVFDLVGAWRTYSPLLIAPERAPWTLAGLGAVVVVLLALGQARGRLDDLPRFHQATLFFALHFWFVVAVIFLVVGTTWREARYLFLVQPFWLFVGAAGLVWLVEWLGQWMQQRWSLRGSFAGRQTPVLIVLLSILALATLYPAAERVFGQQVEGYDRALAFLADVRQAGDVVLSPQPPACALVLGECDYYALQHGYEEFVITRAGALIDRWTGSPLLSTTAQLADVIQRGPRTWFVTDSFRLATRYDADFVQTIIEQFDLAFHERGVMVLRADRWQPPLDQPIQQESEPPVLFGPLALTRWERNEAAPGAELAVTLFWRAAASIEQQFNTSLRVVAADGGIVTQADGPPAQGFIPTNLFFEMPRPDPKLVSLPADLAPGRYRLDVVVYDVVTLTPLREPYAIDWFTVGPPVEEPAMHLDARWANGLRLVGMDQIPAILRTSETVPLRLVWATDSPVAEDYTLFVHLVGPEGAPVAQIDQPPSGLFYPTSAWKAGEWVAGRYVLDLPPDLAPGEHRLLAGLYHSETNERLLLTTGDDALEITTLQLVQEK
jgi:hypothetical protein